MPRGRSKERRKSVSVFRLTVEITKRRGRMLACNMKARTHTVAAAQAVPPVTFRLPKGGTNDPFFGCARTFWNQRVLPAEANNFAPPVKSIVIKQPGTKRGIRLIVYESAKAYFDALAAAQPEGAA